MSQPEDIKSKPLEAIQENELAFFTPQTMHSRELSFFTADSKSVKSESSSDQTTKAKPYDSKSNTISGENCHSQMQIHF